LTPIYASRRLLTTGVFYQKGRPIYQKSKTLKTHNPFSFSNLADLIEK